MYLRIICWGYPMNPVDGEEVKLMKIEITGEAKEIAALILAVQERQICDGADKNELTDAVVDHINTSTKECGVR